MGLLNGIGIGFPFFHGGVAREVTDYIARVTADSGTVDDVTKLSELVEMYKRQNLLDSTQLLIAPFLGYKERISAPYSFLSKLYDAAHGSSVGVEKITDAADRDFSSDTGFYTKTQVTIGGGVCTFNTPTGSNASLLRLNLVTPGKWYKFTYSIKRFVAGDARLNLGSETVLDISVGDSKVKYHKATGTTFEIKRGSGIPTEFDIDNISLEELAWNDAGQTVEVNQLYKAGYIAPNEVLSAKVPNNDLRYFTHAEIARTDTQEWSRCFVINTNWTTSTTVSQRLAGYLSSNVKTLIILGAVSPNEGKIGFRNEANNLVYFTDLFFSKIGKNTIVHLVAAGNGKLKLYINGTYVEELSNATSASFTSVLNTSGSPSADSNFKGLYHYDRMQFGAMTPAQITAETDLLRSWIPEIESVQIGSQVWASSNLDVVATPLGNVIPEVTVDATWATATTLYDIAYAAAPGDAAAKHYAGVKAAAMWCSYNNSTANQAIYGKLYNWYAASLLDLDMASAGYGWRVPISADFTALANALGGAAMAGGKMKKEGTVYFNTPNTGADNSSGFTTLGNGIRNAASGAFANLNEVGSFKLAETSTMRVNLSNSSAEMTIVSTNARTGSAIRLIKTT